MLDEFREQSGKGSNALMDIPLFVAHGTVDEQVPHRQSEEFLNFWESHDATVTRRLYQGMGHTCSSKVEEDIKTFLCQYIQ